MNIIWITREETMIGQILLNNRILHFFLVSLSETPNFLQYWTKQKSHSDISSSAKLSDEDLAFPAGWRLHIGSLQEHITVR